MTIITADVLDNYNNFQYIIPSRLASHKSPYVKVKCLEERKIVAYILLKNKEIVFYQDTPVVTRKSDIEEWIDKNYDLSKKRWNQNHKEYQI